MLSGHALQACCPCLLAGSGRGPRPPGYIENCLLPAVQLWQNYHGDIVNDSIAVCMPAPWIDIKLYESMGNVTRSGVISQINDGVGFCHYSAHGNQNGVYWANSDTLLHSVDALALTNGDRLGVHNSIACIPGAFDAGDVLGDCMAEHLMNNPDGGAVAVIMNSRVGLGTPPDMGPSEVLSLEFYRKTFREELFGAGMAHGVSKDVYVPLVDALWYYGFCIAELNLFGDAALAMWTAEPTSQTVEHPAEIPVGPSDFTVTVTSGGSPLQDALVCVMSDAGDVYQHAHTGAAGEVVFGIEPAIEGTLRVTSTAMNHLPSESTASTGPTTGVEDDPSRPSRLRLALRGNPARGEAGLVLGLPSPADVDVRIFDVTGREVALLALGKLDAGWNPIVWDGRSRSGVRCASGVYFCRASAAGRTVSEKFVLLS